MGASKCMKRGNAAVSKSISILSSQKLICHGQLATTVYDKESSD